MASFTFDNYVDPVATNEQDGSNPAFNTDHNPAAPVGLGPSSSSDGLEFYQGNTFPLTFHHDAFVTRWNGTINDGGDSLPYRDVVGVDIDTADVRRIASGFRNPLDVTEDGSGNLLVADYAGSLFLISPNNPVSTPYVFTWDSDDDGSWSDRLTWNADSLDEDDRLVPNAWGTARYEVVIDRPGDAAPIVTLDRNVTVEMVTLAEQLTLAEGTVLTVQDQLQVDMGGSLQGHGRVAGLVHNDGPRRGRATVRPISAR